MDASCADKLILLVQANPVLYNKSAAGYKDPLKKGDIWRQVGVEIGANGERTTDLCCFSFLVSRFSVAV